MKLCPTCEEETETLFVFSHELQKDVCPTCFRVFKHGFDTTISESEEFANLRREDRNR